MAKIINNTTCNPWKSYIEINLQGTIYREPTTKNCVKCGKSFDLLKYGFPGDPFRRVCYECESVKYYNTSNKKANDNISFSDLDAAENRCLNDIEY